MTKYKKTPAQSRSRTWSTFYDPRAWAEMKARNGYSLSTADRMILGLPSHKARLIRTDDLPSQ
jgi:hypothetical protein